MRSFRSSDNRIMSVLLGTLFLTVIPGLAAQNEIDGFWVREFGESRWEWNLDGESYLFQVHREDRVRSGSRGTIHLPDEGEAGTAFVAAEITRDGELWTEVVLDPEDATILVELIQTGDSLRFAVPDRPQFYIEYRRFDPDAGDGEPENRQPEAP